MYLWSLRCISNCYVSLLFLWLSRLSPLLLLFIQAYQSATQFRSRLQQSFLHLVSVESDLILDRDFSAFCGSLTLNSFLVSDCSNLYCVVYPLWLFSCVWSSRFEQVYPEEIGTYGRLPRRTRKCSSQTD